MKSWRVDRIINALVREIVDQILVLENEPVKYDEGYNLKVQILFLQNEIERLTLKRELVYDAYMESTGYDGKSLSKNDDFSVWL